ncbi:DNA primase small subunit-like [Microplitis mediator]|uniref:DNA primase small subunit-like n=1 Tax=Microplitis mediator TaxID=375433 RepID=UPI00255511B8|nr:DNA primase small subunit-like [Microplitis mediator]XP_057321182.1 DNA primase small subunit-like [Microplitis mediator]
MHKNTKHMFLKDYYKSVFPKSKIKFWLTYGNIEPFELREFSFRTVEDKFSRYESFENEKELYDKLLKLIPNRIDVGPIYNKRPFWNSKSKLIPLKKELVIDIDLTDYDDIRICCAKDKICGKCWKYMKVACKIINSSLQEDWNFKNILWAFSGRRGIHAWVCDKEVLMYDTLKRSSISGFYQLISGNCFGRSRIRINIINPFLERSLKIIDQVFIPLCVVEQDMLGNERVDRFIDLLPSRGTKDEVKKLFESVDKSEDRWNAFVNYFNSKISSESGVWVDNKYFIEEIKLLFCYPRIDRNVTTTLNHLLKLPFSIHPATNRVSVPFDPADVDSFDPLAVPTLWRVIDEKNNYIDSNNLKLTDKRGNLISYAHKTSLEIPLKVLDKFLVDLYRTQHPERLGDKFKDGENKVCKEQVDEDEDIFADS